MKKIFVGVFKSKSSHEFGKSINPWKKNGTDTWKKKDMALKELLDEGMTFAKDEGETKEDILAKIRRGSEANIGANSLRTNRKSRSDTDISKRNRKEIEEIIKKIEKEAEREKRIEKLVDHTIEQIREGMTSAEKKTLKATIAKNNAFKQALKQRIIEGRLSMEYRDYLPEKDAMGATKEILGNLWRDSMGSSKEELDPGISELDDLRMRMRS